MEVPTQHSPLHSTAQPAQLSKARLWSGRIISGLAVLFLTFDAVTKIAKEPHVMAATAQLGFPERTIVGIGTLLLVCTILHVIPRTAPVGAILLTGYLGGAVVTNVRFGDSALADVFPALVGVLIWVGLVLRDDSLRVLIAPRR
jgi:hypothetical protein